MSSTQAQKLQCLSSVGAAVRSTSQERRPNLKPQLFHGYRKYNQPKQFEQLYSKRLHTQCLQRRTVVGARTQPSDLRRSLVPRTRSASSRSHPPPFPPPKPKAREAHPDVVMKEGQAPHGSGRDATSLHGVGETKVGSEQKPASHPSLLWPFGSGGPIGDQSGTVPGRTRDMLGMAEAKTDMARGQAATRRVVTEGVLDSRYKPAARRVTALIVALPFAIYLSYELFQRRFLGKEQKKIGLPAHSTEAEGEGETV